MHIQTWKAVSKLYIRAQIPVMAVGASANPGRSQVVHTPDVLHVEQPGGSVTSVVPHAKNIQK